MLKIKSHITLFGVVDDGLVHTYQKKNLDGKKTVQNKTELRSGVYRGARWGSQRHRGLREAVTP